MQNVGEVNVIGVLKITDNVQVWDVEAKNMKIGHGETLVQVVLALAARYLKKNMSSLIKIILFCIFLKLLDCLTLCFYLL